MADRAGLLAAPKTPSQVSPPRTKQSTPYTAAKDHVRRMESAKSFARGKSFMQEKESTTADFGGKNISYFAGVALLINNITGPGVPQLPNLFAEAGWLQPTVIIIVIWIMTSLSTVMYCEAMRKIPGNEHFRGAHLPRPASAPACVRRLCAGVSYPVEAAALPALAVDKHAPRHSPPRSPPAPPADSAASLRLYVIPSHQVASSSPRSSNTTSATARTPAPRSASTAPCRCVSSI